MLWCWRILATKQWTCSYRKLYVPVFLRGYTTLWVHARMEPLMISWISWTLYSLTDDSTTRDSKPYTPMTTNLEDPTKTHTWWLIHMSSRDSYMAYLQKPPRHLLDMEWSGTPGSGIWRQCCISMNTCQNESRPSPNDRAHLGGHSETRFKDSTTRDWPLEKTHFCFKCQYHGHPTKIRNQTDYPNTRLVALVMNMSTLVAQLPGNGIPRALAKTPLFRFGPFQSWLKAGDTCVRYRGTHIGDHLKAGDVMYREPNESQWQTLGKKKIPLWQTYLHNYVSDWGGSTNGRRPTFAPWREVSS